MIVSLRLESVLQLNFSLKARTSGVPSDHLNYDFQAPEVELRQIKKEPVLENESWSYVNANVTVKSEPVIHKEEVLEDETEQLSSFLAFSSGDSKESENIVQPFQVLIKPEEAEENCGSEFNAEKDHSCSEVTLMKDSAESDPCHLEWFRVRYDPSRVPNIDCFVMLEDLRQTSLRDNSEEHSGKHASQTSSNKKFMCNATPLLQKKSLISWKVRLLDKIQRVTNAEPILASSASSIACCNGKLCSCMLCEKNALESGIRHFEKSRKEFGNSGQCFLTPSVEIPQETKDSSGQCGMGKLLETNVRRKPVNPRNFLQIDPDKPAHEIKTSKTHKMRSLEEINVVEKSAELKHCAQPHSVECTYEVKNSSLQSTISNFEESNVSERSIELGQFSPSHSVECTNEIEDSWLQSRVSNLTENYVSEKAAELGHCSPIYSPECIENSLLVPSSSKRRYPCAFCPSKFKTKSELGRHKIAHSIERPFSCPQCAATFKTKQNLKTHLLVHSEVKPFSCSICAKSFKTKGNVKAHKLIHSNARPYSCTVCASTFKSEADLKRHSTVHSTNKPFACKHCAKSFKTKPDAQKHMRTHTMVKPFLCSTCGSTFKTKPELKQHLYVHSNERLFSCAQCNVKFKSRRQMIPHSAVHSQAKPFECVICARKFKSRTNLALHKSTHLIEKRFPCLCCASILKTKNALKQHMLIHSKAKPYTCEECGTKFRTKGTLKSHLSIHSKERPFACKKCTATFKTKVTLQHHLTVHSSKKPYSCANCSAIFKCKAQVRIHIFGAHS